MPLKAPLAAISSFQRRDRRASKGGNNMGDRSSTSMMTRLVFGQAPLIAVLCISSLVGAYGDEGGEAALMLGFYAWSAHSLCTIYALTNWGGLWKAYAAASLVATVGLDTATPLSALVKMVRILAADNAFG
jgi:hypothetical protein